MYFKKKKAVSEITSFVLITLIVVVASTTTYVFSKNLIDNNIADLDTSNMEKYMKKFYFDINEISSFEGSSLSVPISFKTGNLIFVNNSIYYESMSEYTGSDYCLDITCYQNNGGYEKMYINLTGSYKFKENITLSPGTYTLLFKHLKNESKISITFK